MDPSALTLFEISESTIVTLPPALRVAVWTFVAVIDPPALRVDAWAFFAVIDPPAFTFPVTVVPFKLTLPEQLILGTVSLPKFDFSLFLLLEMTTLVYV